MFKVRRRRGRAAPPPPPKEAAPAPKPAPAPAPAPAPPPAEKAEQPKAEAEPKKERAKLDKAPIVPIGWSVTKKQWAPEPKKEEPKKEEPKKPPPLLSQRIVSGLVSILAKSFSSIFRALFGIMKSIFSGPDAMFPGPKNWVYARLREVQYDNTLSRRLAQGFVVSIGIIILLAIASAFGVFSDVSDISKSAFSSTTRFIGFSVDSVEVVGMGDTDLTLGQKTEAKALAGIADDASMFSINPAQIRSRVMVLDWVENVMVRRLWPNQIQILIKPRKKSAIWQDNGTLNYIDENGKNLGPADPEKVKNMPLIIGEDANSAAPQFFNEVSKYPQIASHTYAMVRVGDRRWNIKLKNGGEILLPEDNVNNALGTLENLANQYKILDRSFYRLDVRVPGQIILRPKKAIEKSNLQNS